MYFYSKQIMVMILESVISQVARQQKNRIASCESGLKRELVPATASLSSHALMISGIRRCGKSTLMLQMMERMHDEKWFYLNFEAPQLFEFSMPDFSRLDQVIGKTGATTLFFDELQLVRGWELYTRQKLDEGYRVIITGSNASMLSNELGTKLTGRHITQELFPFSYSEFLAFRSLPPTAENLKTYMNSGGFPEYLKSGDPEQLSTLFNDILTRDIVTRYGIKDFKSLHRLASYLFSNIGNRVTATKLKQPLSIGATSTVLSWFSFLEMSYLLFFLPVFSHSARAQLINPRKIYAIDTGLADAISTTMTEDAGRKLENLVFLSLRSRYKDLYYFADKGECDFVAMKRGAVNELVQVCYELTPDNVDRELNGLLQAMRFFGRKNGTIVTFANRDMIEQDGCVISVIPAFEYLLHGDRAR